MDNVWFSSKGDVLRTGVAALACFFSGVKAELKGKQFVLAFGNWRELKRDRVVACYPQAADINSGIESQLSVTMTVR
jgi:hypothetical protein